MTSLFACILSFHNIVARYIFTLANRGMFPARLGGVRTGAHGSPHVASGVDSIVVALSGRRRRVARPRPGPAVLHLARGHLDRRHRGAADRDKRRGPRLLQPEATRRPAHLEIPVLAGFRCSGGRVAGARPGLRPDPAEPARPGRLLDADRGRSDRAAGGRWVRGGCRHRRSTASRCGWTDPPSDRSISLELDLNEHDWLALPDRRPCRGSPRRGRGGLDRPARARCRQADPRTRFSWTALRGEGGFAFSSGQLTWNVAAEVLDNLEFASWDSGYRDIRAVPDLATARPLPWRNRVAHVIADIHDHDDQPVELASADRPACRDRPARRRRDHRERRRGDRVLLVEPGRVAVPEDASSPTRWRTPTATTGSSRSSPRPDGSSSGWRPSRPSSAPARSR